jgi:hypothetical protein
MATLITIIDKFVADWPTIKADIQAVDNSTPTGAASLKGKHQKLLGTLLSIGKVALEVGLTL